MKNLNIIYINAIYCNFLLLLATIALILICGLNGWNPVWWIAAGAMFVLYLFESAMSYDEFQNTHGKVVRSSDHATNVNLNEVQIKKDGVWL